MAAADFLRATNTKRFVVEDSITKVTSDGEPHEMMTMIAVISGLITAIVILLILISLIGCRKHTENEEDKSDSGSTIRTTSTNSQRSSILTIYQPQKFASCEIKHECSCGRPKETKRMKNLEGNLNVAFERMEFDLKDKSGKAKNQKRAHWTDEMNVEETPKSTNISIITEEKF